MDRQLNKKEQKMLMDALDKAREKTRIEKETEEAKRWKAIAMELETTLTLSGSLSGMTKNDLTLIRTHLGIQGVSSLKKQELTEVLVQQIPMKLLDVFRTLDDTRYQILKHIADQGGDAFLQLESHQIDYFKERAILFPCIYKGEPKLVMPQEVLGCFQSMDNLAYREKVRINTEWIQLTQGLLFYYGTLSMNELEKLIKQYTGTAPEPGDYLMVLEQSENFYEDIQCDFNRFSNCWVKDPDQVQKEHQSRPDLAFYPFTKAELLRAGDPDFMERNPVFQAFVDLIKKNYTLSRDRAEFIVEECVYAIRNGYNPSDLFKLLQSQLELKDVGIVKAFMEHIVMLHNHTRQWSIKGYSPKELSGDSNRTNRQRSSTKAEVFSLSTQNKVGRNDPCPCGSGKKFKKCCGA